MTYVVTLDLFPWITNENIRIHFILPMCTNATYQYQQTFYNNLAKVILATTQVKHYNCLANITQYDGTEVGTSKETSTRALAQWFIMFKKKLFFLK